MEKGKVFHFGELGHTISPLAGINFESMLEKKLSRARDAMKRYNLGAILCLSDPNIEYVTNIPVSAGGAAVGGDRYAILPYEGTPIGFEECDGAFHLKNMLPNIRVGYAIPPFGGVHFANVPEAQEHMLKMFADQIYELLKELHLDKERLGIDANVPTIINALEKKGLTVTPEGGKALLEARTIKTPEEQQLIRMVASIVDGCFGLMASIARPGISEREIWGEVVAHAFKQGATPDGGYIVSGPHTWPKDVNRTCSDRRLRPGDVFFADLCNWGCYGYRSCYYRTFSMGPAEKDVKEAYKTAITWLREAEKVLRPGVTTKDVVEKWPDEIELWSRRPPYITDERTALSTFWNNMGHGIGLTLYEPPFFWRPLSLRWPQKLEAGMTIALETQAGTPDNRCGVRIEDMIIITEEGYEIISKWPADEIMELPLF